MTPPYLVGLFFALMAINLGNTFWVKKGEFLMEMYLNYFNINININSAMMMGLLVSGVNTQGQRQKEKLSLYLLLYMTQLLLLGKFEYTGGPIFKVVLEC